MPRYPSRPTVAALALLIVTLPGGCNRPVPHPPETATASAAWFEDVTGQVGLDFTHDPGPTGKYEMHQCMGAGCALFDCDGDGRLDILLLTNGGPNSASTHRLFLQGADGRFRDATAGSGLGLPGYGMGVAVGDINNDGRPDVLITEYGSVRLFQNAGGGRFVDVTAAAGIRNPQWGASAAFFDYDRDGWLDLLIANYVDYNPSVTCTKADGRLDYCSPSNFAGSPSRLLRNRGPAPAAGGPADRGVVFEDVSLASGIGLVPGPGLGVVCADATGDGWPDVFVANDGKPNRLWVNQRNGTFKDEAVSRGVAYTHMGQAFAGMGIAAGDLNNDGMLDLYVTHIGIETNTLWRQGPRGVFRDRTAEAGLTGTKWRGTGFGAVAADFDHDGLLDLALVNGRVSRGPRRPAPGLPEFWEEYAERNQVFANAGDGKFRDVSEANPPFCETDNVGRGLACGDIDGDGAPDLLVTAIGGKARVYRNVCPGRGHWLAVRAVDLALNRDAYGAEVTVSCGPVRRFRLVSAAESICSSSSPVVHFGLGADAAFDSAEVVWPDGTRERFPGGPADRLLTLRKGAGGPPH